MCDRNSIAGFVLVMVIASPVVVPVQTPAFDAASVRVSRSDLPGGITDVRAGGRFTATNATLHELLTVAYSVEPFRIVGGPNWMRSDRFDVDARAGSSVGPDDTRLMLRAMIADRFALRARMEPRAMPVYDLVVRRRDGNTGPRLRPASPSACVDRGRQPGRVPAGELPSCGLLPTGPERMSGRSVPLDLLATQLSSMTGRVVVNRTALTGTFDIDLEWAMTEAMAASLAALTPPGGAPPAPDPNRPGLLTAIDEQLGLGLEPATGPVEVLVVENAERPTAN